jgi:serine/threonine-protein kinase
VDIRDLLPALQGLAELGLDSEAEAASQTENGVRSRAGKTYGDFRIIREIGRGGMGIVYEAEQVELGRRVALKVLPLAASLDHRALQRFRLEAQVAGWLWHPRIVPVIAVGTVDGVPYYAMQFIEGGSLADLIAELRELIGQGTGSSPASTDRSTPSMLARGLLSGRFAPPRREVDKLMPMDAPGPSALSASAALDLSIRNWSYLQTITRLGIQAAEALGYAHDQGVIHRDVKPANLLLDHNGDVWVADFGMADVQGNAGLTLTGDLPGTLRYMSPEQAMGRRALVDRRTDVYSLGATLYELLTLTPLIASADRQEILRRIAEQEPVSIRRVNPAVPIDLATIVTKALSKEPSNRYETAGLLAEDLRLYLEGKPISARRIGPAARLWRWSRRRPLLAGLTASLVLSLLFGVAGITWAWRDTVRQKRLLVIAEHQTALERDQKEAQRAIAVAAEAKANIEAAKARAINSFLMHNLLDQAAPENNPVASRVTLLEVLDRAAAEVGSSFAQQPEVEAEIRLAMGGTYHQLGAYSKSESQYRAALEILQRDETNLHDRIKAMSELGHILTHLGRLEEAEPLLEKATEDARQLLGAGDHITLSSTGHLATLYAARNRSADAERLHRSLVNDYRVVQGPKHPDTLSAMNNLGVFLEGHRKYEEARREFRECLALKRETLGPRHPTTLMVLYNLGHVLNNLGRLDEAEPLLRQSLELRSSVLGAEHPDTFGSMRALGWLLRARGQLDEAERLLRAALDGFRRSLGPDHQETQTTTSLLDAVLRDRARPAAKPRTP